MQFEKFVLNKRAFREEILKGDATIALLNGIAGSDARSEEVASRARARVYGKMSDEARNGTLSRVIGGWRL